MSEQGGDWTDAEQQLVMELSAVSEEEEEAHKAWIDHAFGGRYPEDTTLIGRLARHIVDTRGEGVTEEAYRLARAYRGLVEKRQELMKLVQAEIAYAHPEWLEELNKERSLEEMERMLGLRGEEDPPETP